MPLSQFVRHSFLSFSYCLTVIFYYLTITFYYLTITFYYLTITFYYLTVTFCVLPLISTTYMPAGKDKSCVPLTFSSMMRVPLTA